MVQNDEYLDRLKQYRSVDKGLKKHVRIPKKWTKIIPIGQGKPLYTYIHLCSGHSITVPMVEVNNQPCTRYLDELDRAIIYSSLVLVSDCNTGHMRICHIITSLDKIVRPMPLSEYIHYMEDGIRNKTIDPTGRTKVFSNPWEIAMMLLTGDMNTMEGIKPVYYNFSKGGAKKPIDLTEADHFFLNTARLVYEKLKKK